MSLSGECIKCGETRTLVAKDMCSRCNYGAYKDLTREQVLALPPVPARKRVNKPTKPGLLPELDGTYLVIRFKDSDDNLMYEKIVDRARRNRREPGSEALAMIESAIQQPESAGVIELSKMREIVERMSKYPVPNGSAKETFVEAFKMLLIRLDELEGK